MLGDGRGPVIKNWAAAPLACFSKNFSFQEATRAASGPSHARPRVTAGEGRPLVVARGAFNLLRLQRPRPRELDLEGGSRWQDNFLAAPRPHPDQPAARAPGDSHPRPLDHVARPAP